MRKEDDHGFFFGQGHGRERERERDHDEGGSVHKIVRLAGRSERRRWLIKEYHSNLAILKNIFDIFIITTQNRANYNVLCLSLANLSVGYNVRNRCNFI